MKKTVLKVSINCEKCKRDVLQAVTKLKGIDQIAVDAEKNTLTVVGNVDPTLIAKQVRKTRRFADIISVGPPKPPKPKTPDQPLPLCCKDCELVSIISFSPYYRGPAQSCHIL